MDRITTIKLKMSTRDRLRKLGRKGESWDALLRRLIEEAEAR